MKLPFTLGPSSSILSLNQILRSMGVRLCLKYFLYLLWCLVLVWHQKVLYQSTNKSVNQFTGAELGQWLLETPPELEGIGQDIESQEKEARAGCLWRPVKEASEGSCLNGRGPVFPKNTYLHTHTKAQCCMHVNLRIRILGQEWPGFRVKVCSDIVLP